MLLTYIQYETGFAILFPVSSILGIINLVGIKCHLVGIEMTSSIRNETCERNNFIIYSEDVAITLYQRKMS